MSLASRAMREWRRFLFTGYTLESLGRLRALFGLVLVVFQCTQYWTLLSLDPDGPSFVYLDRVWYIEALRVETHPVVAAMAIFGVATLTALFLAAGLVVRPSAFVLLACNIALQGMRDSIAGDTHHRFAVPGVLLLFLALSPSDARFALRARRGAHEDWEACWPIRGMQLYVVSFYLWAAVAKLRVSGMAWVLDGGKLQEILLRRSALWGLTESGEPIANVAGFWLSHQPRLTSLLSGGAIVLEVGFAAVLVTRNRYVRGALLLSMTTFHVASTALLYVNYILYPFFLLVFLDLASTRAQTREVGNGQRPVVSLS